MSVRLRKWLTFVVSSSQIEPWSPRSTCRASASVSSGTSLTKKFVRAMTASAQSMPARMTGCPQRDITVATKPQAVAAEKAVRNQPLITVSTPEMR